MVVSKRHFLFQRGPHSQGRNSVSFRETNNLEKQTIFNWNMIVGGKKSCTTWDVQKKNLQTMGYLPSSHFSTFHHDWFKEEEVGRLPKSCDTLEAEGFLLAIVHSPPKAASWANNTTDSWRDPQSGGAPTAWMSRHGVDGSMVRINGWKKNQRVSHL